MYVGSSPACRTKLNNGSMLELVYKIDLKSIVHLGVRVQVPLELQIIKSMEELLIIF